MHKLKPDIKVIPTSCKTGAGSMKSRKRCSRFKVDARVLDRSRAWSRSSLEFASRKSRQENSSRFGSRSASSATSSMSNCGFVTTQSRKKRLSKDQFLKSIRSEALVECPHCSYRGRPKYWDDILAGAPVVTFQCPACGKTVGETQGKECAIKSIKFSQNEPILN